MQKSITFKFEIMEIVMTVFTPKPNNFRLNCGSFDLKNLKCILVSKALKDNYLRKKGSCEGIVFMLESDEILMPVLLGHRPPGTCW